MERREERLQWLQEYITEYGTKEFVKLVIEACERVQNAASKQAAREGTVGLPSTGHAAYMAKNLKRIIRVLYRAIPELD